MERNEFLKMCQKVSMLPDGVMHTKKNVPNELQVCFDGKYYYPSHLEIKFDENGKVKKHRSFTRFRGKLSFVCQA